MRHLFHDENLTEHTKAIAYARELADKHNLEYVLFDSHYDSSLNEPRHLN